MIKDSGTRRDFGGAVRDMGTGKGRFDLMPLDVMASFMDNPFIGWMWHYDEYKDITHLYSALEVFCVEAYEGNKCQMMLEVAKHMEEGCNKYGERNWQSGNGIPVWCYVDSAIRHYIKWLDGQTDEPHNRAVVWNLMCCIWTITHIESDKFTFDDVKQILDDENEAVEEINFEEIEDLLPLGE